MPNSDEQSRDERDGSHPSTIRVIVVGLGLAGLTAAIECHRKGHSVIALERKDEVSPTNGDGIGISPNGAKIIRQWGDVDDCLQKFTSKATHINIFSPNDEFLRGDPIECFAPGNGYLIHRGTLVHVLYKYARSIGVDIRLSSSVTKYWETSDEAGVEVNGSRITADCVICAEGIHSRGREAIIGQKLFDEELKSEFSAFRGYLHMDKLQKNPETQWLVEEAQKRDVFQMWMAKGTHLSFFTSQGGKVLVWYAARKIAAAPHEYDLDHTSPTNVKTALEWIKDWPVVKKIQPVIEKAVHGFFINTRHAAQLPLKRWRSPHGRMMVIGDAAHPTPPASAQSGSQAIEDGAVLAISLELAGKNGVPMALQVAERIRYDRASAVQFWGGLIQNAAFEEPYGAAQDKPDWLWEHDCQKYAYQEYHTVAETIRKGQQYVAENGPRSWDDLGRTATGKELWG